jgi:hypothetical protein
LQAVQLPSAASLQAWQGIRERNCYSHHWVLGSRAGGQGGGGGGGPSGKLTAGSARPAGEAAAAGAGSSRPLRVAQQRERTTSQLAFRPLGKGVAWSVQMSASLAAEMCRSGRKRLGVS